MENTQKSAVSWLQNPSSHTLQKIVRMHMGQCRMGDESFQGFFFFLGLNLILTDVHKLSVLIQALLTLMNALVKAQFVSGSAVTQETFSLLL